MEVWMGLTAFDQLLALLLQGKSRVAALMMAAGFSEDEIREAWDRARDGGFAESTGLGQDRLTNAGRRRPASLPDRVLRTHLHASTDG